MVKFSTSLSNKKFESLLTQASYVEEKGEIRVLGQDWILITTSTFKNLFEGTEKILGSGATVVWFSIAQHTGREIMKTVLKGETNPQKAIGFLETFFTQGGWGKVQIDMNFEDKRAAVKIENCATARDIRSKEPICHFVRGFVSGVAEILFGSPTKCFETKCSAKGDSFCEFQVEATS